MITFFLEFGLQDMESIICNSMENLGGASTLSYLATSGLSEYLKREPPMDTAEQGPTRLCRWCRKPITGSRYWKAMYCSPECKMKMVTAIRTEKRDKQSLWKLRCMLCGNYFKAKRKTAKFCSNKCRQRAYREK
jgi:hypothetical protein